MKKVLILLLIVFVSVSCSEDDSNNDGSGGVDMSANLQPTGSSSNDLLSDITYTSIVIELVYVEGFQPTQTAVSNFVSFLEDRTFKPGGITVEARSIPSPGLSPYTTQEIADIESANRTKYNTDNQVAIWAFFADGEADGNSDNELTLGTAYRNTSFVIYEESIDDLSGGTFQPSQTVLESTVIHHEFGHILGLTNLGAPLQSDHEDEENPKHCDVESCLMYFAAETGAGATEMVSGGNVPQLDSQCIADLQANGGK
ncbi:membrane metalloprotease [Winogradskyella sp. A3E31]|uniref:membrane metalloprotease n=1 Tax=Winogradskyella sp. A3E31 TaxID=3349637 RepID=UPI00398BAD35